MGKCKVYTRTGDQGETSLVGGRRVSKSCLRLQAYGTVDELNSQLGLLLTYVSHPSLRERLLQCQRELFLVGAALATPAHESPRTSVSEADVADLEHAIDVTAQGLPPWRGFTLPGGSRAAAVAHVCRTVCRRAERDICSLQQQEAVPPQVPVYVNRLSDYLYVLALRLNQLEGVEEERVGFTRA